MMERLGQIFLDCQHSVTSQPKLIKKMISLYLKSDLKEFVDEFTRLLKYSLVHGDKQPVVERTLSFVVKFATAEKAEQQDAERDDNSDDEGEADPFLENLIVFLLRNHEASNAAVRLRICQLLSMLFRQMGAKAAIDNDLYDVIYETMLHRLQDKIPGVRKEAVLALTRLQDPHSKECPVIEAYCFHLSRDPNHDVRRAVLNNIAVTYQTLPVILDRTRDVKEQVRCQAYLMISQKIHLKSLTIAQRVRLISEGLKDRHEMVRNCVKKKLIPSWLRMLEGNVLDLLTCLDVEASVKEAELVLKTIFELIPFSDLVKNIGLMKQERIVSPSELRPESALFWRCLAQHLRQEGIEEALEEILPDLTLFCSYLTDFVLADVTAGEDEQDAAIHVMEREFITNQLISMVLVYDMSDEVGRRSLDQMVRNLLVSEKVGESLVKGLVQVFSKLHPPNTRINQLAEIISEIREPLCRTVEVPAMPLNEDEERKKKLKVAGLKVKINEIREELQKTMLALDLEKAQKQKDELLELEAQLTQSSQSTTASEEVIQERNDSATLIKCLTILCNIMECSEVKELTPALQTLLEGLILGCLRSEDPAVRNPGVKALGLLCLLAKDLAKQYITLLIQVSKIDVEKIQITALGCVIDLLHLYGIEEFNEAADDMRENPLMSSPTQPNKEECVENGGAIIATLCDRLDCESLDIRTLVAEGLCKLLLSSRITSSKLLSRLILMFYNPTTGDDSILRHILGVFFPLYASEDSSNQESLCEAVMPTLQTLMNAPSHSPLASVDVDNVTNFLISITSPTILTEESQEKSNVHDTLVFTFCTEILTRPSEVLAKVLLRCLNTLQLTRTNYSTLRQLDVLASKILKNLQETSGKSALNTMKRFQHKIQDWLSSAPDSETPEENTTLITDTNPQDVTENVDTPSNRTETTVLRRKRMLYDNQTISDPALFPAEGDSDFEAQSPSKKIAHSLSSESLDDFSVTSQVVTSTQVEVVQSQSPELPGTELRGSLTSASANSDMELTLIAETPTSEEQQEASPQQDQESSHVKMPSPTQSKSHPDEGEETPVPADELSQSTIESSSEHTSDEEPTPPKVPHLIGSSHGRSRRSNRRSVLAEETQSDSSELGQTRSRRIKSLPADPLHISSSNSSTSSASKDSDNQDPFDSDKSSSTSRKRSKKSTESPKPISTPSDVSSGGSSTRSTRSSLRRAATDTPTNSPASNSSLSGSQSLTSSAGDTSSPRISRTRHSKKLESEETATLTTTRRSSNSKVQSAAPTRVSKRKKSK